ncbi:MAG TPA: site-2 protease family protein [Patescibacteria group bacterium]|jgi:Zn-dependent protease|nr:site-2 protease family protein [Patescibacteria group bacterium]
MNDPIGFLSTLAILVFSAIVHEVSHGLMAEKLGDSTARDEGRITLNPLPHIDPFASILLPGFLLLIGSPIIFGAAKPVPVNFNNLRPRKLGMALVSLAGPLSNFILAALLILPLKFGLLSAGPVADIWLKAVIINVVLGTFNLLPIPPLDGSKIIASVLPTNLMYWILSMERYGFFIVIIFLYLGLLDKILVPVVTAFFRIFGIQF